MAARRTSDEGFEAWRRARLAAVNADDGPAALVETVWLDETDHVPGTPGPWTAAAGGAALAAGELVPFAARRRFDAVTVQPVLREGRAGVRVYDHARQGAIAGIGSFPWSERWVVAGSFEPLAGGVTAGYGYALEAAVRDTPIAGVLRFELAGRAYETRPLGDERELLLVFADATTGPQTKPPGRFLDVAPPSSGAGEVVLDFNRAYLPPCAFSNEFNCPLPPPAHRLAVAVTAGETFATSERARATT